MPLRSVGLALLAGVLVSCCFPVLLFGVCVGCWLCCGLALLLLYSCLGSLLCFLPPLSCLRGLWWLVSLQGSPGSCHVMLSCPCIPSPCFRGLGVCVWTFSKEVKLVRFLVAGGPGPLCQAWSNEARHNGGCNLGRRVVYLQLHGHDEGDVQTLVLRVPSLVCVSSCCFPI